MKQENIVMILINICIQKITKKRADHKYKNIINVSKKDN